MSETARVLNAEEYAFGHQPFLVEKVAEAALAELKRKREARAADKVEESKPDPVAAQEREEAAELKLQAARLLKAAQNTGEQIVREAQAQAVQIASLSKEKGYQEGFAQGESAGKTAGESAGREEGRKAYAELLARFGSILEQAQSEKNAYFSDREALLVELATRIAAKVIHREVDTREDHTLNLLRQSIRELADKSKLVVFVHPDQLSALNKAQSEGTLVLSGVKQIEFLADDKMVPGGLRIAAGYQTLDATLDNQLAEICRCLLEEAYHEA